MIRSSFLTSGLGLVAVLGLVGCGEPSAFEVEEIGPSFAVAEGELVVCPTETTRSTSAVIGRRGGTLELDGHRVSVPFDAVRRPTEITLIVPASRYLEIDLRADGQEHFQFRRPLAVTISYARCDLDQQTLNAWEIDPATKELIESLPSRDDEDLRAVTFETDHFSFFALAN